MWTALATQTYRPDRSASAGSATASRPVRLPGNTGQTDWSRLIGLLPILVVNTLLGLFTSFLEPNIIHLTYPLVPWSYFHTMTKLTNYSLMRPVPCILPRIIMKFWFTPQTQMCISLTIWFETRRIFTPETNQMCFCLVGDLISMLNKYRIRQLKSKSYTWTFHSFRPVSVGVSSTQLPRAWTR